MFTLSDWNPTPEWPDPRWDYPIVGELEDKDVDSEEESGESPHILGKVSVQQRSTFTVRPNHAQLYDLELTPKEERMLAKERLGHYTAQLRELEVKIKECKQIINREARTGATLLHIGQWRWRAKQKAPVAQRLAGYLELLKLRREQRQLQQVIAEEKRHIKHPFRRRMEDGIAKVFHWRRKYRAKKTKTKSTSLLPMHLINAAAATPKLGAIVNPWMWYRFVVEGIGDYIRDIRQLHLNIQQTKELSALLRDAKKRLHELPILAHQIQKRAAEIAPGKVEEYARVLTEEEGVLKEAIAALEHKLNSIPVAQGVAGVFVSSIDMMMDFAQITQNMSAFICAASSATSIANQISMALCYVTAPLAAILVFIGVSSTIENIRTTVKDLLYMRRYSQKAVSEHRRNLQNMAHISRREELFTPATQDLRNRLLDAGKEMQEAQTEIDRIERELLQGIEDQRHVNAFKEARQIQLNKVSAIREGIRHELAAIIRESEDEDKVAAIALSEALEVQWLAEASAADMENTFVPYIRERVVTKMIAVSFRAFFDAVMITSTALMIKGFFTSFAGGLGAPAMAAAAALGAIGGTGQIVTAILVKRIRKLQCHKTHIKTSELKAKLKDRLRIEVMNWNKLEAAGLAEQTNAYLMFYLLKRHYNDMPAGWGPKEWAQALVNDKDDIEWPRLNLALTKMKNYEFAAFFNHLLRWGRSQYRKLTGSHQPNQTSEA